MGVLAPPARSTSPGPILPLTGGAPQIQLENSGGGSRRSNRRSISRKGCNGQARSLVQIAFDHWALSLPSAASINRLAFLASKKKLPPKTAANNTNIPTGTTTSVSPVMRGPVAVSHVA
jgi:hypothetical protein